MSSEEDNRPTEATEEPPVAPNPPSVSAKVAKSSEEDNIGKETTEEPAPAPANAPTASAAEVAEEEAKKTEEPAVKEESASNPPPATPSATAQLPSSTFEDDGTFALPPGTSSYATPVSKSPAGSVGNSKGAQILMGRFSTWRQQANKNANILWKQAKEAQAQAAASNQGPLAALRQVSGVAVGSGVTKSENKGEVSESEDDDDEEEEEESSEGEDDEGEKTDAAKATGKDDSFMVYGDEDDDKLEDAPSSSRPLNLPTRKELRNKAQAVASNMMESMDSYATGFRGRYATTGNEPHKPTGTPSSPNRPVKESQTSLILKSRAASHLQEILDSLEPYQYVLLLGAGRLQVNLKNPYVKHQGTYVDFLVRGGAADKSGVVMVGDSIVKVGSQDVRKHTIADVPNIIAQAKRPVVLVLTTGVEMDVERITYLDLAVAMMHQIRAKDEQQKRDMIASATKNKEPPVVDSSENQEQLPAWETEDGPKEEEPETAGPTFEDVTIPTINNVEDYANPPQPPMTARLAYKHLVGKRCNDNFSVTEFSQFAASDDHFRAALRNAFLSIAVDGRRFVFLGRHLTMEQDVLDNSHSTAPQLQQPNKNSPNALLMLFLELTHYADLHGVTPVSRRRSVAERIAYKFFLPTKVKVGSGFRLEPPMFDFHHLVPDSVLRTLEGKLSGADADIAQDLFLEFQHAVVDALCGTTFLLFLVSNHCARMRAFLRNSAPYRNVPLKQVFEALTTVNPSGGLSVHSGSKNYFLYVLIYLMQLEKDPTSTLSTDGSTLLGRNGRRMVGAAGGLCCYLFMGRVVIPAVKQFKQAKGSNDESMPMNEKAVSNESIVTVFGQLWELFLTPGVGALEHTWKSKETKEHLEVLRAKLRAIRKDVLSTGGSKEQVNQLFAEKFATDAELSVAIKDVADHLLYDYAINTHPKFREHIFHEWLCNEFVKANKEKAKLKASEEAKDETKEGDATSQLPELPAGCIKRLLRKVDLPIGVSPHKPIHSPSCQEMGIEKPPPQGANNPNADCAIVFGSQVGAELAVRMQSPAMDHSDIRRYTCQDCTVHGDKLPDSFEEQIIPPTLESYAVLPPTRVTGFSEVTGNVSLSSDGFEVSLVNFSIPKAGSEAEAQSRSLYGVSLVFQRSSTARFYPRRISQTQLVRNKSANSGKVEEKKTSEDAADASTDATIDEDGEFPSPISFNTPSDDHWSTFTRTIKVSNDTPVFNGHLREKAWVDRVLQDETRDQTAAPTIGIALVSRRNVVIAMRQALWMLLRDFSRLPEDKASKGNNNEDTIITCGSLVDLLGNFAHQDVEPSALKCLLEPYIRAASAPWIERPILAQQEEFQRIAGQQLITCLPPIPLALLFIAALLEQKIILSSSRRSILFSATEALTGMLKPLKWCHLLVPLVPAALAKDLVSYPAPFILGCNSEEPAVMSIMNDLPMDVTLVDLDVGRVILAPEFSFDSSEVSTAGPGPANEAMSTLRSQVLYLAQILGSHFGAKLFQDAWSCDSPSLSLKANSKLAQSEADYDILKSVCRNFIEELLAGVSSSCFWIEEEPNVDKKKSASSEPTVLFDEDRFFFIKRWREENGYEPLLEYSDRVNRSLALSMDGFNMVLECFVRCQSMNLYLSSQSKDKMAFSL